MSMQRTAESALHSLEELYRALDLSSQQQTSLSMDDSEHLVQALCNLSQLINHINQTGMCGHTPIMRPNFEFNRFNRKKMNNFPFRHANDYDEHEFTDSPMSGQPYGECVLYHPIRIITTGADGPTVLHGRDFVRREEQYRKDHGHSEHSPHHRQIMRNRRRTSKSHGRHPKRSRSRSRGSRMSRRSRRSSRGRMSQSRDRSSRSSRRSSRSSRRRSHSHGRRSRSSRRNSQPFRSSQRRSQSRQRDSTKRRSTDRQYHDRQIPSRPISTTMTQTVPSHLSNPIATTLSTAYQQPYVRSLSSSVPITATTTSSSSMLPPPSFTPTLPLPPPPVISALHHHSHPSSQIPIQPKHISSSSVTHVSNIPGYQSVINPISEPSPAYQQVPISSTGSPQQQSTSLFTTNPLLITSSQRDVLSSSISPLQTTDDKSTSRSDNCPECRAITRLLQWAPLKCYDAAGIRRGVFLAGPKSERLLKALYSSIKDSSFSLDDIEDCLCDNE